MQDSDLSHQDECDDIYILPLIAKFIFDTTQFMCCAMFMNTFFSSREKYGKRGNACNVMTNYRNGLCETWKPIYKHRRRRWCDWFYCAMRWGCAAVLQRHISFQYFSRVTLPVFYPYLCNAWYDMHWNTHNSGAFHRSLTNQDIFRISTSRRTRCKHACDTCSYL